MLETFGALRLFRNSVNCSFVVGAAGLCLFFHLFSISHPLAVSAKAADVLTLLSLFQGD